MQVKDQNDLILKTHMFGLHGDLVQGIGQLDVGFRKYSGELHGGELYESNSLADLAKEYPELFTKAEEVIGEICKIVMNKYLERETLKEGLTNGI